MATTAKKKPASATKRKNTVKKTVKKPVAKSAASSTKTTSKKVTSAKKTTTKKVEKAPAITSKRVALTPFEKLRNTHFSGVLAGVLLIILTMMFVTPIVKDFFVNYQARDVFVKSDEVNLTSATELVFSLDLRYLLVAILGLTVVMSVVIGSKLYSRYEKTVKAGISGFRWIFYGLVMALVVELASLMAGVQDVVTLKLTGLLVIAAYVFAWLSERENAGSKKPKKVAFYAAVAAYLLAHLPIVISLITTPVIGAERFGWEVYVLSATVALAAVANLVTLKSSIYNKKNLEYVAYEQRYVRIDQIAKLVIVLAIFSAFSN